MFLKLLVFLGLKKKPAALKLLEDGPYRAGTISRVARMASKTLTMLYWYEVTHKNSVFQRTIADNYDPAERLMPLFSILDGCIEYGANIDVIEEIKIKIMKFAAKEEITIQKIDEQYQSKTNYLDDIATEAQATRGFWAG